MVTAVVGAVHCIDASSQSLHGRRAIELAAGGLIATVNVPKLAEFGRDSETDRSNRSSYYRRRIKSQYLIFQL